MNLQKKKPYEKTTGLQGGAGAGCSGMVAGCGVCGGELFVFTIAI